MIKTVPGQMYDQIYEVVALRTVKLRKQKCVLHRARREELHNQNYQVFQFACREEDEAKLKDCRGMNF